MPAKAEYWRNPEKHRAKTRAYAEANPDWKRKSNREWVAKKRKEDPDFVEKERAANKKYREEHAAERVAATAAWARNRPGQYLLYNAKARAKKHGVPFDLAFDDVLIPEFCPVLGIPLEATIKGRRSFHPNSPSIDRIVPERGYVKGNICVISNRANWIKRDGTADEHRRIAAYIDLMAI